MMVGMGLDVGAAHGLLLHDVMVTTLVLVTTVTGPERVTGVADEEEPLPPKRPPIQPRMPPPEDDEESDAVAMGEATRVTTEPVTTGAPVGEPVGMGMMLPDESMVPGEPWYRVSQSTVLTKSSDHD